MGKPFGEGLKYMQLDVEIHDNDKIDMLRDKFKDAGFLFWVLVHARIFEDSFYWVQDETKVNSFCRKRLKTTRDEFNKMLDYAFEIRVFNREMFDKYNILTSKGIQKRYLVITKKWSKVKIVQEYMIDGVDIYAYQLSLYTKDGRYIGYKNKNDEEIFFEEFVPRKHVKQDVSDENRAEVATKSISEQLEEKVVPQTVTTSNGLYHPNKLIDQQQPLNMYIGEQIFKDVCTYYGFTEMNFPNQRMLLATFLRVMDENKRLQFFETQFYAYKNYKTTSGGTKHGFENFIGHQSAKFGDGIWQTENWEDKLKEVINFNNKKNGTQSKRPAPSGDFSSKF